MKITGIILILCQVLAYMSGNFKIPDGPLSATLGSLLGYNLFGIIGIILLVKADKKKDENKDK